MKVQDIFDFLNKKYPSDNACSFDNVGILAGDPSAEVKNVLLALDCTAEVIKSAKQHSCGLIITHHPVIFEPLKNVLAGSIVYELINNGLSVISMHTNLDVGSGGVNDSLCDALGFENYQKSAAADGYLLNIVSISPAAEPGQFAGFLKERLGGSVKYVAGKTSISRLLICSGSGGGYLSEVIPKGCDALLTADVKHNVFLEAEHLGISLYDAGHFNTEDVVIEPLKHLLQDKFKDIEFYSEHLTNISHI